MMAFFKKIKGILLFHVLIFSLFFLLRSSFVIIWTTQPTFLSSLSNLRYGWSPDNSYLLGLANNKTSPFPLCLSRSDCLNSFASQQQNNALKECELLLHFLCRAHKTIG